VCILRCSYTRKNHLVIKRANRGLVHHVDKVFTLEKKAVVAYDSLINVKAKRTLPAYVKYESL
jgi:hypothetical protein